MLAADVPQWPHGTETVVLQPLHKKYATNRLSVSDYRLTRSCRRLKITYMSVRRWTGPD